MSKNEPLKTNDSGIGVGAVGAAAAVGSDVAVSVLGAGDAAAPSDVPLPDVIDENSTFAPRADESSWYRSDGRPSCAGTAFPSITTAL
jgi:hypothetical protein